VETLSGAAEMQFLCDSDEVSEVPELHVEMVVDPIAFVVGYSAALSTTAGCVDAATS